MFAHVLIRHVALGLLCVAASIPQAQSQNSSAVLSPSPIDIERFLPVHTKAMSPGPFEAQRRPTGVSRPFFLVGCDAYSLAWIERNRDRLRQLHAFGLVVEGSDAQAYRHLTSLAEGLLIRPVAGDAIAKYLRIEKYPALVTADGILP
jgi:integrating conjugative element protein (TIGR03765 family)